MAWAASLSTGQDGSADLLAGVDMLVEDLRDEQLRALLRTAAHPAPTRAEPGHAVTDLLEALA